MMAEWYNLIIPAKVKVLIFNHTRYKNRKTKGRPAKIGDKFEELFERMLGESADIFNFYDLKFDELDEELVNTSQEGLKYSALIVCVSSHGNMIKDKNGIFHEVLYAFDSTYKRSYLWRHFKDKEAWKGKPKLFFIQACRGEDATAGVVYSPDNSLPEDKPVFYELKLPDLFIMNASQQGTVSWKSEKGGSFFIDTLIEVFNEKCTSDLLSMAVEISGRVAKLHEVCESNSPKYECCQQMPCFETTLTKQLYFSTAFKYANMNMLTVNPFYIQNDKRLAIILNYSYDGTNFPSNVGKARANKNAIKLGVLNAGFKYMKFWDVSKANLSKLLKTQSKLNDSEMVLVIFNGYGERDELYLNDEKIKVHELWEPLLPDEKTGETLTGKPKIFLISASSPDPSMEGVSGKIDKLCKPSTNGNVQKCQEEQDNGQVNLPITADLLILYETSKGKISYKNPGFRGSPFIQIFSDELMDENHSDFLSLITKVLNRLSSLNTNLNEEVPLAFSTLRKLVPVRCFELRFDALNLRARPSHTTWEKI